MRHLGETAQNGPKEFLHSRQLESGFEGAWATHVEFAFNLRAVLDF